MFLVPVGHLPHIPASSGALQPLPELAWCVLIVVLCLAVVVECAKHMLVVLLESVRCTSVVVFVAPVDNNQPTHSDQFRFDSTIARTCIVC